MIIQSFVRNLFFGYHQPPSQGAAEVSPPELESKQPLEKTPEMTNLAATQIERKVMMDLVSGFFWVCVGMQNNPAGGIIYKFEKREKYKDSTNDEMSKINSSQLYPAIEVIQPKVQMFSVEDKVSKLIRALGYDAIEEGDKTVFFLPDVKALNANWEKMCEANLQDVPASKRPRFKASKSPGILPYLEFARACTGEYDVTISSGVEFIHDQFFHALPRIQMILTHYFEGEYDQYSLVNENLKKMLNDVLGKVEEKKKDIKLNEMEKKHIESLEVVISAYIDIYWAKNHMGSLKDFDLDDFVLRFWRNEDWFPYFLRNNIKTPEERIDLWKFFRWITNPKRIDDEADKKAKSGVRWRCAEKFENPAGGYIYEFKMFRKGQFEYIPKSEVEESEDPYKDFFKISSANAKSIMQLGYGVTKGFNETVVYLPDRDALNANWTKMMSEKGISSEEAIELLAVEEPVYAPGKKMKGMKGLGTISSGNRFMSDHAALIPKLDQFLSNPQAEQAIPPSPVADAVVPG